jgi:hypothetical protein
MDSQYAVIAFRLNLGTVDGFVNGKGTIKISFLVLLTQQLPIPLSGLNPPVQQQ